MAFTREQVGYFAFVAGLFISLFVSVVYSSLQPIHIYALGLLGIVIGLLNIEGREVFPFMLAVAVFLLAFNSYIKVISSMNLSFDLLNRFMQALVYIIGPAAFVVSLRIIYESTKTKESLPYPLREEAEKLEGREIVAKPLMKKGKKKS
ncbi:MAG: hypothetical protein NZ903_03260 [Candidatus Micrarchaeota archaeon]|nr:hypothetical protein [Candidatus Micrarchaeota archaeon]